ncbi:Acetyl-coenzyme A synthetase [Penicillium frequentans]|nr:Acetyl-coenzyme A synthetase [Penicillium glabrum]
MTIFRRERGRAEAPSDQIAVPSAYFRKHPSMPHLRDQNEYQDFYQKSIDNPDEFWSSMARVSLKWDIPFDRVHHGSFEHGNHGWFLGGKLNVCYNCVDRHALENPEKLAIIYEHDDPKDVPQRFTYGELLRDVSKLSWVLKDLGVQKGDIVTIYLPNIPEAIVTMLACARIGAVHSVVFAGFSAPSLRGRLEDARSRVIITADEFTRGGKITQMKTVVEDALTEYKGCKVQCLVLRKTGSPVPWSQRSTDFWWHEECARWPGYCEPVPMGAEDPLYMLYTSGSTGKPKGLIHTTAGYLLSCAVSGKYVLDLHPSDTMFCAGDVGWITGHNYLVYTPLVLGITTVVFEGTPAYPNYDRFWQILDRCKASHFYAAPTALRMIKKNRPNGSDKLLERLRVIASIGEPLASNVWQWCYEVLGRKEAHVLDTYFQTETACHAFSPLAGVTPTKPGTVALPFVGFQPALIDPDTGREIEEDEGRGLLVFKQPWPGIARTVWGDHARYMKTYFEGYKGYFVTGDSAYRDRDGYYRILGRVDDVVNISGHRLSTAEIESALLDHGAFAEVAVVGVDDQLTGQALNVFACLKNQVVKDKGKLESSAKLHIGGVIGRFAVPKKVFIVSDLPKTRSGKIMRRLLRAILEGERNQLGDTSTLLKPAVVLNLIDEINDQAQSGSEAIITPGSVSSSEDSNLLTHSPFDFPAYNLTCLDHILPPCHMFMFLSFEDASMEGIDALRHGVTRLSENFPFLTGVVVPSTQSLGKTDVFEVKPASAAFLREYPMLKVAFSPEMDMIAQDDFIQQKYLPIPFLTPPTEPMPLVRFQANVTGHSIILCVAYNHRALDSTGVSVVLKILSEFCRAPDATPESLSTNGAAETAAREHIRDFQAKEPLPLHWTPVPLSLDATLPVDPAQEPVSRPFSLSAQKIALLKDACNKIITSESHSSPEKICLCTSNDIITALVGFCGNKARQKIVPEAVSPPRVIIAANARKQCQLPPNYMGNALVAVETTYDPLRHVHEMVHLGFPGNLSQKELGQVCSIAIALREQIGLLSGDYLQGILRNMSDRKSLSSFHPAYGRSIIVSSLRWMDFYLDFGPMGRVKRYDIPEKKVLGVCWVLPARELAVDFASQTFELRFVLERGAMQRLQEDSLFTWMMTD